MSTEQMRQEFEEAFARGDLYAGERETPIQFQDYRKHCAWVAFQLGWTASRSDAAVELPLIHRDNYANAYGYNCALEAVSMTAKRIEAAGLKVKP